MFLWADAKSAGDMGGGGGGGPFRGVTKPDNEALS